LEGAQFTAGFFADSTEAPVQAFVKAYKERYATLPGTLAAQAFDAASILCGLLGSAANREDLRDQLETLREFKGVTGATTFGGRHDASKKLAVLQVQHGQFTQVP
jgi:branched-chain amino acid transport system substrate-binding protein